MSDIWSFFCKETRKYWAHKMETIKFWWCVSKGKKFLIYDTETTGLKSKTDSVIEFSAIVMEKIGSVYQKTDETEIYINPGYLMGQEVIDIHHITNEFLSDKPYEEEAFKNIRDFFEKHKDAVIMGYNIGFDNRFMLEMFKRNKYNYSFTDENMVDVFSLVKENIYNNEHAGNRHLEGITEMLFPASKYTFHNSSEDILATWGVGTEILKRFVESHPVTENSKPVCNLVSYYSKDFGGGNKYLFVTILTYDNCFYDIYYSLRQNCWVNKKNEDCFSKVNMDELESRLKALAVKMGKKDFYLLQGSARFM